MHSLVAAVQDEASRGFDWSVLIVPVIAGSVTIAVTIYNTRGETAALRRLKAMNDVLAELPKDSDALASLTAARDLLAERVAVRLTGPRPWKKIPAWGFGVIAGAALAVVLVALTLIYPPQVSGLALVWNLAAASAVFGVMTWSFAGRIMDRAEARRRVEAAKRAHPSRRER